MPEAVPYQVHTVLTDNGIQVAEQPRNRNIICSRPMRFDMICEVGPWLCHRFEKPWRGGIEHRLTRPGHPWANGQIHHQTVGSDHLVCSGSATLAPSRLLARSAMGWDAALHTLWPDHDC